MAGFNITGISDAVGKLAGLLDVFDMSFLVSGFVAMLGWGWFATSLGLQLPDAGVLTLVFVGGAYVNGMVCFAAGRWIRRELLQRSWTGDAGAEAAKALWDELAQEAPDWLETQTDLGKDEDSKDFGRAYRRMWVELRERATPSKDSKPAGAQLRESYLLARSFWIRAATLDGLAAAALLILALGLVQFRVLPEPAQGFGLGSPDDAWSLSTSTRNQVLDSLETRRSELEGAVEGLRAAHTSLEAQTDGAAPAAETANRAAATAATAAALLTSRTDLQASTTLLNRLRAAELSAIRSPGVHLPTVRDFHPTTRWALLVLALIGACLCWWEARKNDEFQRKELMATLQWHHLDSAPDPDETA